MTQEDKQLLLADLCARLPYYPKCEMIDELRVVNNEKDSSYISTLFPKHIELFSYHNNFTIKPYLRPISSMTEEEKHELLRFGTVSLDKDSNANDVCCVGFWNHAKVQDYLNSIHIDYRGLIPKKLAIEVTEENNPYEKK